MTQGVASTRQMTFTKSKNETSPAWLRDGKSFLFLSNREAPDRPENEARRNQLYVMSPEGGEARRITDAKEGVSELRRQPRRPLDRLPFGQDRRRTALQAADRRALPPRARRAANRDADGRADHETAHRRRLLEVLAR